MEEARSPAAGVLLRSTVHACSLQCPARLPRVAVLLSGGLRGGGCPLRIRPSLALQAAPVTAANQRVPVNRPRLLLFRLNLLQAVMKGVLLELQPNRQLSPRISGASIISREGGHPRRHEK